MGLNTRFDKTTASNASATTITWTTNEPTVSYTYTIADGSAPTSTELGIALATLNTQMSAIITLVGQLKTAMDDD